MQIQHTLKQLLRQEHKRETSAFSGRKTERQTDQPADNPSNQPTGAADRPGQGSFISNNCSKNAVGTQLTIIYERQGWAQYSLEVTSEDFRTHSFLTLTWYWFCATLASCCWLGFRCCRTCSCPDSSLKSFLNKKITL